MRNLRSLFDVNKTIQVAAFFLKQSGLKVCPGISHLKLLKLLYLTNRTSLKENATLIVFDRAYALPNGPILSTVYNLIKKDHPQMYAWQQCIETGWHNVFLKKDVVNDELSPFEEKILHSVSCEYGNMTDKEIICATHELPEWKKYESRLLSANNRRSYHIELRDIVDAIVKETNDILLWERVKKKIAGVEINNSIILNEHKVG